MIDTSLASFNLYFLFAVFQGFILSGLILLIKPFKRPHLYLSLLIVVFSLSLLHLVLVRSIHAFNAKYPIPMDFSLAYGPLAYLHTVAITDGRRRFCLSDLWHFLPTLLIDGALFSLFFIYVRQHMPWAYAHLSLIQTSALVVTLLSVGQLVVYAIAIFRKTRQARAGLKEFANIATWLNWLLICWVTIIVFLLVAIPISLLDVKRADENASLLYTPFGILIGVCLYGLGYLYLLRYRKGVDTCLDRMARFKFSEEELGHKARLVTEALQTHRYYKDPAITVSKLARKLGWPVNDLSLVINEAFHTNFNDWINLYRVREFKELLEKPESRKYTMTGLSQEAGFSSKASFYRAFKKATGVTPSDYLKSKAVR
jgi:AraC-like DNA-binding protein